MESRKIIELPTKPSREDDLREFLIVVRRALLLVVRWIEKRYCL